jgi:hypothetical protein
VLASSRRAEGALIGTANCGDDARIGSPGAIIPVEKARTRTSENVFFIVSRSSGIGIFGIAL